VDGQWNSFWIPAFAGMTEYVQEGTSCWWSEVSAYHGQASLRPCHPSGRAEGLCPSAFFSTPKIGDSPQEKWGTRGLRMTSSPTSTRVSAQT